MHQLIVTDTFSITGMDCPDCAAHLEKRVRELPGVVQARLNFTTAKLVVDHTIAVDEIIRAVHSAGYCAEVEGGVAALCTFVFHITGMDCADCAAHIVKALNAVEGIEDVQLNFATAKLTVKTRLSPPEIIKRLEESGYTAMLAPETGIAAANPPRSFWQTHLRLLTTLTSGVFLVFAWVLSHTDIPRALVFGLYLLATLIGGLWTFRRGITSLKTLSFDMNALMTIAVTGAILIHQWEEAASVAFLYSVSNLLESYSMERTRQSIRGLMALAPRDALTIRAGEEVRVPVEQLSLDDSVIVKPGEMIPVDGLVIEGISSINQAPITGESIPVEKREGDSVYAGTLNTLGALKLRVTKIATDTELAKIIHLVEEAQAQRAPSQAFVDRFARYYTPAVLLLAVMVAIVPPVIFHQAWSPWLYRALALLVVSCPCALVISTPVAIVSAIGNAARHGVLIKGGAFLEQAGSITAMAFDKTGTLTQGRPDVTDLVPLGTADASNVLRLAAAVEQRVSHPLADAILRRARQEHLTLPAIDGFTAVPGQGATATIGHEAIFVGSPKFFETLGVQLDSCQDELQRLQAAGKTIMLVGSKTALYGILAAVDQVRPESARAIAALRSAGIARMVMLTGDHTATARTLAEQVGVDEFRAELMPAQKVGAVEALRAQYGAIAMVGDGINDAPALATANLGIAMGAAGTDTALETADIALMADDLSKLAYLIRLSRKALWVIKENIALSLLIKGVALVLIFPGWLALWLAVLADMGASILVTLNGLRLVNGVTKKTS